MANSLTLTERFMTVAKSKCPCVFMLLRTDKQCKSVKTGDLFGIRKTHTHSMTTYANSAQRIGIRKTHTHSMTTIFNLEK